MYIAIFTGEKNDYVLKIKTLSDVLITTIDIMKDEDYKWEDIVSTYKDKDDFIKNLDVCMGDNIGGYVIGVDVDENTLEIMHIKYEWVIDSRMMTPEKKK